jgi:hypothetical protein
MWDQTFNPGEIFALKWRLGQARIDIVLVADLLVKVVPRIVRLEVRVHTWKRRGHVSVSKSRRLVPDVFKAGAWVAVDMRRFQSIAPG